MAPDVHAASTASGPMLTGRVAVVRAERHELPLAIDVLEEAAAWVDTLGHATWERGSFRSARRYGNHVLREALDRGDLYLARLDDRVVATVTLQWSDPLFWPDAAEDAGYVHRLAVRRDAAGLGIGGQVLGWAERRAGAEGRRYLRLDCPSDNARLRRYYESAGFLHRGDRILGPFDVSLYEKPLDRLLPRDPASGNAAG
jgi:ribosomal protein S18 acetylase RimI-like enzyme